MFEVACDELQFDDISLLLKCCLSHRKLQQLTKKNTPTPYFFYVLKFLGDIEEKAAYCDGAKHMIRQSFSIGPLCNEDNALQIGAGNFLKFFS